MHNPQPTTYEVNGAAIRSKRKAAGVELKNLAARAGISRRYLSHLETGTRASMRPERYIALRTALNATDEELLAPPTEPTHHTHMKERHGDEGPFPPADAHP